MQSEPLEHRIWIDAPLADVWQAWTDEESITQWFAPGARVEPWVGGAFELVLEPSNAERHNTRGCKFIEVVPHERLTFEWKGPEDFAPLMNKPTPRTQATVIFVSEANGTRVQLIHSGWGEGPDWDQARSWHEVAWSDVLEALKRTLEEAAELRAMEDEDHMDEDEMGYESDLGFDDLLRGESRYERGHSRPGTPRPGGTEAPRPPAKAPVPPPIPDLEDEEFEAEDDANVAPPPRVTPKKNPATASSRSAARPAPARAAASKAAPRKAAPKKATPKKAAPKKTAPKKAAAKKSAAKGKSAKAAKKAAKKAANPVKASGKKPGKSTARKRPAASRTAGSARNSRSAAKKPARKSPARVVAKRPAKKSAPNRKK